MSHSFSFRALLLLTLGVIYVVSPSAAQEADIPGVSSRPPGTYYKLFDIEFEPGKADEGVRALEQSLLPAWDAAGVSVVMIEHLLQTKDVSLLIELKDGPKNLTYSVSEQDAQAWAALVDIAGGASEAEERVDKLVSIIARQSESLVFIRERN